MDKNCFWALYKTVLVIWMLETMKFASWNVICVFGMQTTRKIYHNLCIRNYSWMPSKFQFVSQKMQPNCGVDWFWHFIIQLYITFFSAVVRSSRKIQIKTVAGGYFNMIRITPLNTYEFSLYVKHIIEQIFEKSG